MGRLLFLIPSKQGAFICLYRLNKETYLLTSVGSFFVFEQAENEKHEKAAYINVIYNVKYLFLLLNIIEL